MEKLNIVITGSSSGFGNLTVQTLAKDGHKVFATMRDTNGKNQEAAKKIKEWAQKESLDVEVVELDVTDENSVNNAFKQIADKVEKIDVVVNNAGIVNTGIMEAFTIDQAQKVFDVNVYGPLRVNRAVLPHMRKQKSGLLIHISSGVGRIVMPFIGIYNASKFALEALAECYRYELSSFGVDSVIIEPGAFPTDIFNKMMMPGDEARLKEYGEFAEMPNKMFSGMAEMFQGSDAPNPQEVADAVKKLVDTPAGQRPIRTPVGKDMEESVTTINNASAKVQEQIMEDFQMKDLMSIR